MLTQHKSNLSTIWLNSTEWNEISKTISKQIMTMWLNGNKVSKINSESLMRNMIRSIWKMFMYWVRRLCLIHFLKTNQIEALTKLLLKFIRTRKIWKPIMIDTIFVTTWKETRWLRLTQVCGELEQTLYSLSDKINKKI